MCNHITYCDRCGDETCDRCLTDCNFCWEPFCKNCIRGHEESCEDRVEN